MSRHLSTHIISIMLTLCALVHCDAATKNVLIKNNSPHELFGALYQTNSTYGLRMGEAVSLQPGKETALLLPHATLFKNRMLYVDAHKENLLQKIDFSNPATFFVTPPVNVNFGRPTRLVYVEGTAGSKIIPATALDEEVAREDFRKSIAQESPHYNTVATVSKTKEVVWPQEASFITQRMKTTQSAVSSLLGEEINVAYVPRITLCASGGGFRAMLATLGAACGLEEIGIWNTLDYAITLSGSSWALIPWLQSTQSLSDYSNFVTSHITEQTEEKLVKNSLHDFNEQRYVKALFGHNAGLTDLYSIVLSKRLLEPLKEDHLSLHFSDLTQKLDPAQHPYPLCSAATPYEKRLRSKYHWLTMSPWNIEITKAGLSIPTWALTRRFMNGSSIDAAPEPWLGYLMGIWGSAFSTSIQDILLHAHTNNPDFATLIPRSLLKSKLMRKWLGAKRCTTLVPNFTYGMPNTVHNYKSTIPLVDAGHYCNLPVPPLLHPARNPDLIIMLHSSINDTDSEKTLRKAFKLLRKKYPNLSVDHKESFGKPVIYWPSSEPKTPSILHIGLYKNERFDATYNPRKTPETSTFNFWYTTEQARKLTGLMKQTIIDHAETFKQAVRDAVKRKQTETSTLEWLSSNAKALFD